jgi:hypothetical protein
MRQFLVDLLALLERTADEAAVDRLCGELERRHARGETWAVDLASAVTGQLHLANAVSLVLLRAERDRVLAEGEGAE